MEAMITATLMPSILATMEGFSLYPWVAAAYLLASVVATPLFGRWADVYGYRRLYCWAVAWFLCGSALCGMAQSMPQLIAARTVQGVGSAGLITLSVVLFGAVFPIQLRARMQAMISATWAVSSTVGPSVGALCVEYLSWRWAFFINVPAAVLILVAVSGFGRLAEHRESQKGLEVGGAALFTAATLSAIVLLLSLGQLHYQWLPVLFVSTLVFVAAFIRYLRKADHPILPIRLFLMPSMTTSLLLIALVGALLFSLINFLPLHVQGVLGERAAMAGYVVTVIAIGTFAGSLFSGFTLNRIGFRSMCMWGALISVGGLVSLVLVLDQPLVWPIVMVNVIVGVGLAMVANATIVAIQALAPSEALGAASSLFHFLRMLGGTLGIALLGGIQLGVFQFELSGAADASMQQVIDTPQNLFDPFLRTQFSPESLQILAAAMQDSLQWVFVVATIMAVGMLVLTLWMPKSNPMELEQKMSVGN